MNRTIKTIFFLCFFASAAIISFQSCQRNKGCGISNIAKSGEDDSHNMGKNCMNCHMETGRGKGCFNAAGTAYNTTGTSTISSGTVTLRTGPNGTGTVAATIQVDSKGNFYTTEAINFNGGLYPSLTSGGKTAFMGTSITMGQCNSCHGVSTGKITAP